MPCPGCGHACATILPYRVGVTAELTLPRRIAVIVLGPIVGGGLGGLLLGEITAFPVTLRRDVARRSRS